MRHSESPKAAARGHRRSRGFWTKTRVALALVGVAAVLAVAFATLSRTGPKRGPNPLLDADLQLVDGGTFRLGEYDGKVLVLNLWATWCGPCRKEIPHLVELNREYKARGVEFVGLSTEEPVTSREKVRDFAREFQMDYRLGFADRQFAALLMQGRTNIPQLFVLRDGRVLNHFIGYTDARPQELRQAIEQALKAN